MPTPFSNLRQVLVASSPPAFHVRDPQLAVPMPAICGPCGLFCSVSTRVRPSNRSAADRYHGISQSSIGCSLPRLPPSAVRRLLRLCHHYCQSCIVKIRAQCESPPESRMNALRSSPIRMCKGAVPASQPARKVHRHTSRP